MIRSPVGVHELRPARLRQIDALVEAWPPGSEGDGVADPLFGPQVQQGQAEGPWPRTLAQQPINVGDRDDDPPCRAASA